MSAVRVLLCTCPPDRADAIATGLLERRIVACVNVIGGVASRYVWKTKLRRDDESLLIVKTTGERVPDVISALKELHPYDVPELLSLAVEQGAEPYLRWVNASCAPNDEP